jgi:hypothetical protein
VIGWSQVRIAALPTAKSWVVCKYRETALKFWHVACIFHPVTSRQPLTDVASCMQELRYGRLAMLLVLPLLSLLLFVFVLLLL